MCGQKRTLHVRSRRQRQMGRRDRRKDGTGFALGAPIAALADPHRKRVWIKVEVVKHNVWPGPSRPPRWNKDLSTAMVFLADHDGITRTLVIIEFPSPIHIFDPTRPERISYVVFC